jgi:hypothetical protein
MDVMQRRALRVDTVDDHQGQPSFRVESMSCTWVYHVQGAGFASILDPDGHDWISYRPTDGPRGKFRGLPNLVHPGAGFHPGGTMCTSRVVDSPSEVVEIESHSLDQQWRCGWTFHPDHALMTLHTVARPYWILYEGTPGGTYDETDAYCVDSAGTRRPCNTSWQTRLPDPRSIWFSTSTSRFALFLTDLTTRDASVVDSFWSMEQSMTVFGMGRKLGAGPGWRHLTETPCRLAVGMALRDEVDGVIRRLVAKYSVQ